MSEKGHRILRVDEYHFGQAEEHPSRGLDVFSLVTSFLMCILRRRGVAVMIVMV